MDERGDVPGSGDRVAIGPWGSGREENDAGADLFGGCEEVLGARSGMEALEQDAGGSDALEGAVSAFSRDREDGTQVCSFREGRKEPRTENVPYKNENYAVLHWPTRRRHASLRADVPVAPPSAICCVDCSCHGAGNERILAPPLRMQPGASLPSPGSSARVTPLSLEVEA